MHTPFLSALLAVALWLPLAAAAAPVAEDQRTAIDLRRTTLVVNDVEASLAFYRDALGMRVIYDNMVNTPAGASNEDAERVRRLVFLRANDDYVGIVGLLQYVRPEVEKVDLTDAAFKRGTVVLVFNSDELETSFAKATTLEGVTVLSEPSLVSYPSYDGSSEIRVMVSVVQDPDGFVVELNQLQDPLH